MMRHRTSALVALAALGGVGLGASFNFTRSARADHGAAAKKDIKAPISEVLHCPLAFEGVHLMKELPAYAQKAYHYCKSIDAQTAQCLLYDGTGPDAKLIGVEYMVSDAIYQTMPEDEKTYWHDHKHEVDAGLLKSLTQTGAEEKATLATIRPLWGKIFHTWTYGKTYPRGPARVFWSVTGQEPFTLPEAMKSK